ncbi:MAG: phosphatase PAP2 family protein [Solobacterium sp.]|nr:phosphatase PAP2 family protein [Solobacterium sp.]
MDIWYLLLLQAFREATNNVLTPFLEQLSLFAVTYLIMIPAFIYWIADRSKGFYTLVSYYVCCGLNAIVKLTACVYRPWIRDPRVVPAGDSIRTATGYSFPSGHTSTAGPIYGGIALTYRKVRKWISVICLVLLFLTMFSRNYLGVHTPQDVLAGFALSVLSLWAVNKGIGWLREHPGKEDLVLLGMFIFGWLAIVCITFKQYPMLYVNGQLLVDPQKMMNDGYGDIALLIAFPPARYIERRWIGFESPGLNPRGLFIGVCGLLPMIPMIRYMKPALDAVLGSHWGHLVNTVILVFYVIALFPLIIKSVSGKKETGQDR